MEHHGLDNDNQVFFYEHEFYCFSNFSSFAVEENALVYPTSEHLYHCKKFDDDSIIQEIMQARSAHDAQIVATRNKDKRRSDWQKVKVQIMKEILILKMNQHLYIQKKLLETGDREIIENSWRDSFWGWGENQDGQNTLGKLWMEIRDELEK